MYSNINSMWLSALAPNIPFYSVSSGAEAGSLQAALLKAHCLVLPLRDSYVASLEDGVGTSSSYLLLVCLQFCVTHSNASYSNISS